MMNATIIFVILILQTLMAMLCYRSGIEYFYIWVAGCIAADAISGIVWAESK